MGLKAKDALHIASAIEAGAEYFLTTDDKILNKAGKIKELTILSPADFIKEIEKND
jgi:predicted nucleic acid-binding protein